MNFKQLTQALAVTATLLIAQPIQAETFYFHNDHLGTPQALTDDTGTVVWQGNYSPFGEVTETTDTVEQNIRFPGQYFEEETGLHYNYYRDYDPGTGRYIESDPIGLQGGINTFGYALSNPTRWTDSLGLDVFLCRRPADLPWPLSLTDHYWIQTDSFEAGMGEVGGGVPAQNGNSSWPGVATETTDHSGQSDASNASCEKQENVDEKCVDKIIQYGTSTGNWHPYNQCQSFAYSVITQCRTGPQISR